MLSNGFNEKNFNISIKYDVFIISFNIDISNCFTVDEAIEAAKDKVIHMKEKFDYKPYPANSFCDDIEFFFKNEEYNIIEKL